jgi:hypothetical protein
MRYLPGRTMRVLVEVALDEVGYTDKMIRALNSKLRFVGYAVRLLGEGAEVHPALMHTHKL